MNLGIIRNNLRKKMMEIPSHTFTMGWDEFWQKFNEYLNAKRYEILLHHLLYNYNPEWNYKE